MELPSYVDETSQARLHLSHGLSPRDSFDDSNNAEDQTRQDETAVQANRHLGRLCTSGGRVDGLVFPLPVACL